MRVRCPHCNTRMITTHSNRISKKVTDGYVNCPNPECCCRGVLTTEYKYDIIPPLSILTDSRHEWFANLPDSEKRAIIRKYQPSLL